MTSPAFTLPVFANFVRCAPTNTVPSAAARRTWLPLMLPTLVVTVPDTGAYTGVPRFAMRSLPSWKPVSERGKPQSFMKWAPGTGQRASVTIAVALRGASSNWPPA